MENFESTKKWKIRKQTVKTKKNKKIELFIHVLWSEHYAATWRIRWEINKYDNNGIDVGRNRTKNTKFNCLKGRK